MYRLDKTAFKRQTAQEADHTTSYWKDKSAKQKLNAASYLILAAYGMLESGYPPMDKTMFHKKKRP
jgi:hypothetical protein